MKNRFSSLDVYAIVSELKDSILGNKLVNVYEAHGQKEYVFKFNLKVSQSNALDNDNEKFFLLVENGIRCHRTMYRSKEFSDTHHSGPLLIKLRSLLRGKRVSSIWQVNSDRVMIIEFDGTEYSQPLKLILEFFSEGNIIITDSNWTIMAIHRIPKVLSKSMHVGDIYSVENLSSTSKLDESSILNHIYKSKISNPKQKLSKSIASIPSIGQSLSEHIILSCKCLYPHLVTSSLQELSENDPGLLYLAKHIPLIFDDLCQKTINQPIHGYLIHKTSLTLEQRNELSFQIQDTISPDALKSISWTEYHPVLLVQHQSTNVPLPTFSMAVDVFHMLITWNKQLCNLKEKEKEFSKRLESVSHEIDANIKNMIDEMNQSTIKAQVLQDNIQDVQKCLLVINTAIDNGMKWTELEILVRDEQKKGNPIANMIQSLDLEHGRIIISLDNIRDIPIIISKTSFGNVQYFYEEKKRLEQKYNKTIQQKDQVLKDLKLKLEKKKDKGKKLTTISAIIPLRKSMWFEKFHWFISSENILVIGGRDAHQNEQIVKRYMKSKDIYVHADISGAPSVLILVPSDLSNKDDSNPIIPYKTILEAGSMAICNSNKAWSSRVITSAFWVHADQVTRTAPSGEYLPSTGSFVIRGKKHYIPHSSLVYGFGILFKLGDDDSSNRHKNERVIKEMRIEENQDICDIEIEKLNINTAINTPKIVNEPKIDLEPKETTNRGKSSKLKKIKTKYRHQDEEERALRMNLLKSKEINIDRSKEKGKDEDKNVTVQKIYSEKKKQERIESQIDDAEIHEEQSRSEQQCLLDSFTGIPHSDDILSYAIAVCAPYSTLNGYKYKVKLVPGSLSKGKSVKSSTNSFIQMKNATMQEIRLIKQISEEEAQRCMLNHVKISFIDSKIK